MRAAYKLLSEVLRFVKNLCVELGMCMTDGSMHVHMYNTAKADEY